MKHSRDNHSRRRTLSMPGVLKVLVGFGLLLVYRKFLRPDGKADPTTISLLVTGGIAFLVWGVAQLWLGYSGRSGLSGRLRGSQYRVTLPRPGVVYLLIMVVAFVGSLLGRSNMLMLVFALLAGPFVLNGWITFSMLRRLKVIRKLPLRAMAGDSFPVEIVLHNRKFIISSWMMNARDQISSKDENLTAEVLFARVGARKKGLATYSARLMRRGRYEFGPVEVISRFPLGLVERGRLFHCPGELLVHPRIGHLPAHWLHERSLGNEVMQKRTTTRGVYDDEFHRIREYRPGDSPRVIHWRSSARHNELMVREFDQRRDNSLLIVLDLWLPDRPNEDDIERVEMAVSLAATIAIDHLRKSQDGQLFLAASGEENILWEGRARRGRMESLLDQLAVIQATSSVDLAFLAETVTARCSPGTRGIFITTRNNIGGNFFSAKEFRSVANTSDIFSRLHLVEAGEFEPESFFSDK